MAEVPLAGITASNLTTWSAKELNRTTARASASAVSGPGGPADEAKPSLREDDVIVVDGRDVRRRRSALNAGRSSSATRSGKDSVPLLVGFERGRPAPVDGHRRRRVRPRGSGARGAQGVDSGVGAGADPRARRQARSRRGDRRAGDARPRARPRRARDSRSATSSPRSTAIRSRRRSRPTPTCSRRWSGSTRSGRRSSCRCSGTRRRRRSPSRSTPRRACRAR